MGCLFAGRNGLASGTRHFHLPAVKQELAKTNFNLHGKPAAAKIGASDTSMHQIQIFCRLLT